MAIKQGRRRLFSSWANERLKRRRRDRRDDARRPLHRAGRSGARQALRRRLPPAAASRRSCRSSKTLLRREPRSRASRWSTATAVRPPAMFQEELEDLKDRYLGALRARSTCSRARSRRSSCSTAASMRAKVRAFARDADPGRFDRRGLRLRAGIDDRRGGGRAARSGRAGGARARRALRHAGDAAGRAMRSRRRMPRWPR
ncbi:MAG: hypothetical protein MZV49_09495 [Rhodopseudomonas palustris]|nr:hypothetical protein [Rhodopseudomonas palustris]